MYDPRAPQRTGARPSREPRGPRPDRGRGIALSPWPALLLCGALLAPLAGCVRYVPAPLDPLEVLQALDSVKLPEAREAAPAGAQPPPFDLSNGLSMKEACALAVQRHPALRAARAEAQVASAALVEAGLLPDPVVGWDAMDALAAEGVDPPAHGVDYLSGLGLEWPVPRPGEIGARVGRARARVERVRYRILSAEWRLARAVARAFLDLEAARARIAQNSKLEKIARSTRDYFARARRAAAATPLQANLAGVELGNIQLEGTRLAAEEAEARQALNGLLGLPPRTALVLESPADPFAVEARAVEIGKLTREAVLDRPDLAELKARYQQSEEALRLEIARQWPAISIGTGLTMVLPVFTRFNRPAIETALAAREALRRTFESAVFELRREVHAASLRVEKASKQVAFFRDQLAPLLEESLRLTRLAFRAREITLVEILTAQQQVVSARSRFLEARIEYARSRLNLDTITGRLFARRPGSPPAEEAAPKEKK